MTKIKLIWISSILLLFGCRHTSLEQDVLAISIDPLTIKEINMSELISEVEIIPIETRDSVLLGNHVDFIEKDDTFFLFDKRQGTAFSFDSNGRYINNSDHLKGAGPKEIIPHFISYNPYTGNIEMLNSAQNKVLVCDTHFNYRGIHSFPSKMVGYVHYWVALDKDTYLLASFSDPDFVGYSIKKEKGIFRHKSKTAKLKMVTTGGGWVFNYYNLALRYSPNYFNNVVYQINKDGIYPVWKLDFDKLNVPNLYKMDNNEFVKEAGKYLLPMRKDEMDSSIITCVTNTRNYFFAIYSKKNRTVQVFNPIFRDGSKLMPYTLAKNGYLYYLAQPAELEYLFGKGNDLLKKYSSLLSSISEDDNYVIVKYKLRPEFIHGEK